MRRHHQLDAISIIHHWELQQRFIWLQHLEEMLRGLEVEVQFHVLQVLLAVIMDHRELVRDIGVHQNRILRQKWSWGYLECFFLTLLFHLVSFCFGCRFLCFFLNYLFLIVLTLCSWNCSSVNTLFLQEARDPEQINICRFISFFPNPDFYPIFF